VNKKICFVVSSVITATAFLRDYIAALSAEYDIITLILSKNYRSGLSQA